MKKLTYAAALLLACAAIASPASADVINNLSISVLPNPVPQSQSNPCIICGTNAAGQPGDFGYNNFVSTGNLTSFNTFSTNIIGGGPLPGNLEANALPYSGALLKALADNGISFGVAIDINTANGGETLTSFQLINLSAPAGSRIIADFTGSLLLPDINNGNGKGDYLITGFDLSSVNVGDNLIFHASWSGATDGAESFYIVPTLAVPGPIVGAGLPGLVAACFTLLGIARYRRRRTV